MRWQRRFDSHTWSGALLYGVAVLLLLGLFALGVWMLDLSLRGIWYHRPPALHAGFGVLLQGAALLCLLSFDDEGEADGRIVLCPSLIVGALLGSWVADGGALAGVSALGATFLAYLAWVMAAAALLHGLATLGQRLPGWRAPAVAVWRRAGWG